MTLCPPASATVYHQDDSADSRIDVMTLRPLRYHQLSTTSVRADTHGWDRVPPVPYGCCLRIPQANHAIIRQLGSGGRCCSRINRLRFSPLRSLLWRIIVNRTTSCYLVVKIEMSAGFCVYRGSHLIFIPRNRTFNI